MKRSVWVKLSLFCTIMMVIMLLTSCGTKSVIWYEDIGSSVNVLTGSYAEVASGTTSIFDSSAFDKLRVKEYNMKSDDTYAEASNTLQEYVNRLTQTYTEKFDPSVSIDYGKIVGITGGYSFESTDSYDANLFNGTGSVFYDMNYQYMDRRVEIDGYNDITKLSSILSDEFLQDAEKLQSGSMLPKEFINKYGTHIITAGIYGASFDLHYEMITDTETLSNTFTNEVKEGINAQIKASIYGINLGLGTSSSESTKYEAFMSSSSKNQVTRFSAHTNGGNATGAVATSLADFAPICEKWAKSINNPFTHVLIDVPKQSLIFVGDFLIGEKYDKAREDLRIYFENECARKNAEMVDKMLGIYKDSYMFDEETGTLTVNLSALQTVEDASLNGLGNHIDGFKGGVFNIYPKVNSVDIKKVVFKGLYGSEYTDGRFYETCFDNFSIKFDKNWTNDIVIEFENFAYEAPTGEIGLDLSAVSSQNVTIIINGAAKIKGGNSIGAGTPGHAGIDTGSINNVTVIGEENLEVLNGEKSDTKISLGEVENVRHSIRCWNSWGHNDDWYGIDNVIPNLDREKLISMGYTKIVVTMTFYYKVDDWGDQQIQIFSHDGEEVANFKYEWQECGWNRETISFGLSLESDVADDGSFKIKWYLSKDGANSDTWHVGGTTLTLTAVK